ncbi:CPBP family intramembrane glutamic endopeptidase [Gordoniibacillus kamchatkensis]|uniref:CPBP family intramembrane glutamic endopeptidase n=1 Tax=Gordoniibacillus kamchatkensis TaxID=1590651 RepID=UPI0006985A02|nr:CPBP family intramembrane glutamic endopeptidase [Paenibacillus sp. VKM B-2647]
MRLKYWIILALFAFTVGPGVMLFDLNRYVVSLFPPIVVPLILFWLKDEWIGTDWNALLRDRTMYRQFTLALQIAIYAMAADTLIFRPGPFVTDVLLTKYPIMVFYVIVLGPISEEIIYRKIIFGALQRRLPFWAASGLAAIVFGAAHLSPERFLGYAAVGWTFCYIYRKAGTLAPTILAHMGLNFIAILAATLKG